MLMEKILNRVFQNGDGIVLLNGAIVKSDFDGLRLWSVSLVQPLSSLFYFSLVNVIPGMCPIGFSKVMFSSSPFLGKSGSSEGVRKVSVSLMSWNRVVFDCDIMRPTSHSSSNEHDNHRSFDRAGVLDGMLSSKTSPNQGSQACISKLLLRVIHASRCTGHDGLV